MSAEAQTPLKKAFRLSGDTWSPQKHHRRASLYRPTCRFGQTQPLHQLPLKEPSRIPRPQKPYPPKVISLFQTAYEALNGAVTLPEGSPGKAPPELKPDLQQVENIVNTLIEQLKDYPHLQNALILCQYVHGDLQRKGPFGLPELTHQLGVAIRLMKTEPKTVVLAGLLHDTVEDYVNLRPFRNGKGTPEELQPLLTQVCDMLDLITNTFGLEVGLMVAACSDNIDTEALINYVQGLTQHSPPASAAPNWKGIQLNPPETLPVPKGLSDDCAFVLRRIQNEDKFAQFADLDLYLAQKAALIKLADKLNNITEGFLPEVAALTEAYEGNSQKALTKFFESFSRGKLGYCWNLLHTLKIAEKVTVNRSHPLLEALKTQVNATLVQANVTTQQAHDWEKRVCGNVLEQQYYQLPACLRGRHNAFLVVGALFWMFSAPPILPIAWAGGYVMISLAKALHHLNPCSAQFNP